MSEIVDGLFIGDADDSMNARVLWNRNVRCIVNCSNHEKHIFKSSRQPWRLEYYRVGINDDLKDRSVRNMITLLPDAVAKIHSHLSQGHAVLVHCQLGRQRSACVVAAYLIKFLHYTPETAVVLIRKKRPGAFTPFVNFRGALQEFSHRYA